MKTGKKSHISVFFLFCYCSILMPPASITSQGQLTVIVTDLKNMPLRGNPVEICSSALDRIQTGATDAQGICVFKDLPVGSYQVKLHSGFKKIATRKIKVSSEPAVLRMSIESPVGFIRHGRTIPFPVDPTITSFTSGDAKILNEASSGLKKSVASTWNWISSAADVCERREILIGALENWKDMLWKTRTILENPPQSDEKRFMIRTVFEGMIEHLEFDLDSISEFAQNASKLRFVLDTIAKVLRRASESGAATFDLQVVSQPAYATVSYTRGEGTWIEHSEHTPTTIKGLYFAICQISIKREGYDQIWWYYDPYRSLKEGAHQLRANMQPMGQVDFIQAPPSLEKRVHESDLIIVGEIQQAKARRDKIGSDVYTYTTVAVIECVKGFNVLRGDKIVIRVLGGAVPEEGIFQYAAVDRPVLEKGERVVLMLKRLPESGYYQVIAGQHGEFYIQKDEVIEEVFMPVKDFIRKIKEIMKSG